MVVYSPIDRGYAWVVGIGAVFMAALYSFNLIGMGVMLVGYTHYFGVSKAKVSIISMCYMVTGPIGGKNQPSHNCSLFVPFNTIFTPLKL